MKLPLETGRVPIYNVIQRVLCYFRYIYHIYIYVIMVGIINPGHTGDMQTFKKLAPLYLGWNFKTQLYFEQILPKRK